ncbi:hypothetical protein KKC83_01500 [Patescibacteria group bacterium]|nr:hypothetical protein [Candidatus Falkowbacteria bacterium]MBU3906056.1 hypothetical protein [Patescibacteria group bacterium]MBU4015085.1 hypothetical protein [Patescibacteria group bacterium]MBU4026201.1 hypothetical protein [Patescibacteria group bacterium]MBU4073705.1 hypothetical protein [Patescibacteria group bacterium]
MERLRKAFIISIMFVTVLSMSVVVAPQAGATASAGDLIKMDGLSSVYYLGADSKRYVFPNEQTYFSWYSDFSGVVTIPQSELESYPLGANVTVRPGTKLVKITTDPKVYAVESNGTLVHVPDETTAIALYGANWAQRVIDVPDGFFTNYTVSSATVSATAYPEGSLVKYGDSATVYYIAADGTARAISDEAAFLGNRFKWSDVITATIAMPAVGTALAAAEAVLTDTASGAGGTPVDPLVGTGLTVALASDTPASATTLTETTNADGAQALIPVTKVNFTAASDGSVKVTNLKFKRGGIPSADADFAEFYLYDGTTLLAKYSSISTGVLSFNNTAGLFTVAAGTTKGITLKVNLGIACTASRTYKFDVLASSDVTTDGAAVSGSFPITGNTMSTAEVADLGKFTVATSANSSAPDPGTVGHTLWKFTAAAADQNINVEMLKFTVIGTVDATDLANFKLEVAGVQIGSTVAAMASDKTITFNFDTPYAITKGNTKTVSLKGDVIGGTSRTYQIYLNNKEDMMVKDAEYGVYVTPNQEDAWTDINAATATTINAGSLTVSKNVNSPSGNMALGATNVEIGQFDFKSTGEDIKIDNVYIYVDMSSSDDGLYQVKLYVDGSQVGTAANLGEAAATAVSTGNSFIVPAGTTKTLVVKADMKDDDGGALTANETLAFQLGNVKSTDYTKQTSGGTSTTGTASANTLTIKTGTLTAAENLSFGDRSSTAPTGVVNATGVKIASFTLTAGAGEAVTVTQITLEDYSATTLMSANFQNLKIKNGSTQLGNTIGNLNTTAGDYDFSPSPAVNIAAGQQYVVDVYADIKSGATKTAMNHYGIQFDTVTATGDTTSTDASYTSVFELQTIYVASVGNLYISDDADTPIAQQLVMGATDQEVARFKLEANASEDLNITQLVISDNTSSAATGTLMNIKIYDGTTLIGGPVQLDTSSATTTYAHAVFSGINLTIPANGSKVITVKADVATAASGATSASTHTFAMLIDNGITSTETVTVKGSQSGTVLTAALDTIDFYSTTDAVADADQSGSAMTVYRTKISVTWASDTPQGSSVGGDDYTVAKINITNSLNAGNYTATIAALNFAISHTGISLTANRELKIYKDSITTGNLLETTSWLGSATENFGNTAITDAGMIDAQISAGATKLFIITMDTQDAGSTDSLSINVASDDVTWEDSTTSDITSVNTLPLQPKSLTY